VTIQKILDSQELLALCDVIIPPCADAGGAASPQVQKRLASIYSQFRNDDRVLLQSLCEYAKRGDGQQHPYFATFAETVTEAYWTSELGLSLVGFKPARLPAS